MEKSRSAYLNDLIGELSKDDKYLLVVFMLRCQLIEYALKYLLGSYPHKPKNFYKKDFLHEATLGQVIGKLDKLEDDYLKPIVVKAKQFNTVRKYVIHHFLTSKIEMEVIKRELKDKLMIADQIEGEIHQLFDFISDTYHGFGGLSYEQLTLLGII